MLLISMHYCYEGDRLPWRMLNELFVEVTAARFILLSAAMHRADGRKNPYIITLRCFPPLAYAFFEGLRS